MLQVVQRRTMNDRQLGSDTERKGIECRIKTGEIVRCSLLHILGRFFDRT